MFPANILLDHLEMGITDIEELMAFTAKNPGHYRRGSAGGQTVFIAAGSAESGQFP